MKWGFLGIGRVTHRMVDAVRSTKDHSVVAVAGRDPVKLDAWGEQFEVESRTTDFQALVEDPTIEAIYVALPPALHRKWVAAALEAGKGVLCEKPLACNEEDVLFLRRLAEKQGLLLQHATAFPFHPRSGAMREVIQSGQLGDLRRVTVACSFSHILHRGKDYRTDPSLGGGCLLDLGWYCAYATFWMTGLRPLAITGMGRKIEHHGIWSSAQAIVTLEQGVTAIWDCGFDAAGRKWIEVAGSNGSLVCDDFLRPWDLEKPRFWVHGHDGKARAEIVGSGAYQESLMLEAFSKRKEGDDSLKLAVATQSVLARWEQAMLAVR